MPTDNERREVARRLRESSRNTWSLTVGGNSATIRYAISDIVFGDKKYHSGVDLLNRLADLIEPSEPKVRCVAEIKVDGERLEKLLHDAAVKLTGIDRGALLALADRMEHMAGMGAFLSEHGLEMAAASIREACGEVES